MPSVVRKVLGRIQRVAVFFLSPLIRFSCAGGGGLKGGAAPVFIVGAPRTGSTIFYQAITNGGGKN